jgi:hypothetical protein
VNPKEATVPENIRYIDYYYVTVPDKPGEAARTLGALHQQGINLLGVSAFPHGARRAQLDLVPEDMAAFRNAAKKAGWPILIAVTAASNATVNLFIPKAA